MNRLLLALDQFDTGQAALEFTGRWRTPRTHRCACCMCASSKMLAVSRHSRPWKEAERLVRSGLPASAERCAR